MAVSLIKNLRVCVREISCFFISRNTKKEKEPFFSESCYRSQSQRLRFKLLNNKENPSSALCYSLVLPLLKSQRTHLYMSRLRREVCSQKSGMWLSLWGRSLAFPSSDLTFQGQLGLGILNHARQWCQPPLDVQVIDHSTSLHSSTSSSDPASQSPVWEHGRLS